ncbi:MAG: hypothetical protein EOO48_00565 [Flavobacterium sp.]|nr:MAG: hypothetical protein EOO48_00565 [Flavobacterium sp.]
MKSFTIHLAALLCLFTCKMMAQQTFEERAKDIATRIEQITKEEKAALKLEVDAVNSQLQSGSITNAQADERKMHLAESRAKSIETRVAAAQVELNQLVKDKVEGRIKDQDSTGRFTLEIGSPVKFIDKEKKIRDSIHGECRTTSQFVFAFGLNNLETNKQVAHSDFKVWGSHFYEWGITFNTRILNKSNLLHAKYGLSLMYNNLRATDNRYFVEDGNQTNLADSPINLGDSRFRNVYLVLPAHLEFDFSGKKNGFFQTHKSFRFGIGGYAGVNIKSKQILEYEDEDGNDVTQKTKGDFNVNNFIYGVSSYIGYKEVSLYVKYDLNPLFEHNAIDQRNISAGIRFDLN